MVLPPSWEEPGDRIAITQAGEMPSLCGREQRSRAKWRDAGHGHQPARMIVPSGKPLHLSSHARDPQVELDAVFEQPGQHPDASGVAPQA